MQQQPLRSLLFALSFLVIGVLNAQSPTPFWSQNFTGGFPAGWTTTDGSGQNVLWTWCPNPSLGETNAGCAPIFGDALNGQIPFNSTTATTGSMVLDSDQPQQLPTTHVSRLTTPTINCTGKNEVFLSFQTHIGVYANAADGNAILRVSTDGTTWTNFPIFSGLTTTVRWSANPETPIINISSVAANKANVQLQWQWTGNYEYMWSLDDIVIYDQNPTPRNDLAIGAFFYPVSSFATPTSQIGTDTFSFEVNLSNKGLDAQTNVKVSAYVKEVGGGTLYDETITIPSLAAGVTDSGFVFPLRFAPELNPGLYAIGYTLSADSTDQRPVDNARESEFIVTNAVFTKEDGPEQGYRPNAGGDWAVANYYRMSSNNFEKYKAVEAEFAFSTNPDEIIVTDVISTVYLLKVNDDVAEDFSNFDLTALVSSSTELVGINSYEAPDTLVDYDLQVVELKDFTTDLPGVALETGGRYLLAMEYANENNKVFHAFNDDVFYYFPSTFVFNSDWNVNGFGGDINALLRMYISLSTTTDEQALPENTLSVFPNPVRETLQMGVEFATPTDATITIADINGRVVTFEDRTALTKETLSFQLPQLASGTYLARIATANGTLTKKFVVQK